jgi:hypothetical protein
MLQLPDKTHLNVPIAKGLHVSLMEQLDAEQEPVISCKRKWTDFWYYMNYTFDDLKHSSPLKSWKVSTVTISDVYPLLFGWYKYMYVNNLKNGKLKLSSGLQLQKHIYANTLKKSKLFSDTVNTELCLIEDLC